MLKIKNNSKFFLNIFIFVIILVLPWTFNQNKEEQYLQINENSIGYYETNPCKTSYSKFLVNNLFNKNVEIKPDKSSSINCYGKINGISLVNEKITIYVGTNLNIDFIVQSVFYLFILSLMPKSKIHSFKGKKIFINILMLLILYLHLKGENLYYEAFSKNFNLELNLSNFFILSYFASITLIIYLFFEIIETRFYNLINFFPFIFLFNGTYNTFNLNFFVLVISSIGIFSLLEKKFDLKFFILFYLFLLVQINYFLDKNIKFDVDKLKGFVNSSQSIESFIFWSILTYLFITGFYYIFNNSVQFINLKLLTDNFILVGFLLTIFGLINTLSSHFSFLNYFYFGFNKFGMKELASIEGNTWRGISHSAESIGEFFSLIILFFFFYLFTSKQKPTKFQIISLIAIILGMYRANNAAATVSMLLIMFIYLLFRFNLKKNIKIMIIGIFLIIPLYYYKSSNYSYQASPNTLLQNSFAVTEFYLDLPLDENGYSAIDNLNFGELLGYSTNEANISSALRYTTNEYIYSRNISYLPNKVAFFANFAVPINRSEKWGIFLAKYNPSIKEFLFGYGPFQLSNYYLEHKTKNLNGFVLPHSSFLDFLIFYGVFGSLILITFFMYMIFKNRNNFIYVSIFSFLIINYIKSDSILYSSSFMLLLFFLNFYKLDPYEHN